MKNLNDAVLYRKVRAIADMIYSTCKDSKFELFVEDWREESVNSYYNHTESGIFLEMYYGTPSILWTPWGKWTFIGSSGGCFTEAVMVLLEKLGARVFSPLRVTDMGEYGPVYSLTQDSEGKPLPAAVVGARVVSSEEYEVTSNVWDKLTLSWRLNDF
jgi:hypothetical protein